MSHSWHLIIAMAAHVAAIFVFAGLAPATAQPAERSGAGPCRQAALSIISALEHKEDNTQVFVHARTRFAMSCAPR